MHEEKEVVFLQQNFGRRCFFLPGPFPSPGSCFHLGSKAMDAAAAVAATQKQLVKEVTAAGRVLAAKAVPSLQRQLQEQQLALQHGYLSSSL